MCEVFAVAIRVYDSVTKGVLFSFSISPVSVPTKKPVAPPIAALKLLSVVEFS